jgi:hypothetical protein
MAISGGDIASYAQQFLGTPYVWGGNSLTSGVDCSGLVQQVFKHFGINLPRVTYDQIGQGQAVPMNKLQPGDLLFFHTESSNQADHVGIYIGNGKFIEAPRPGKSVQISDLKSGYYADTFLGARRIAGVQGGGVTGSGDVATEAQLNPEELAAEYGWTYSFLNSVPDLKKLFSEYVSQNWTQDKFTAELKNTNWWKTNSDTMREVQAQKATDPATWAANLAASKIQVQQLAAEMGAIIPPNKLSMIAEQALSLNMDEGHLRNVLGGYINFTSNKTLNGEAGQYENSIKQYAYTQGVSLDDQTIKNQAALIGRRLATEQDFKNQIMQQAISAYPAYKAQLEGGQTMMDVANPYIQVMAQTLEMNPKSISLQDPMIKQALNGVNADGKPTGMDQTTFLSRLKSDPRWNATQAAQNQVMNVGRTVLQQMGFKP